MRDTKANERQALERAPCPAAAPRNYNYIIRAALARQPKRAKTRQSRLVIVGEGFARARERTTHISARAGIFAYMYIYIYIYIYIYMRTRELL